MEIIQKAEAIARELNRYFTGKPCKWGHFAPRSVRDDKCVTCTLERQNKKRAEARAEQFPEGRDPWKKCEPGMKVCRQCRSAKEAGEFSPDARASDKLQSRCRECSAKAKLEIYHADIEAARAARREHYARNKGQYAERAASYRERHGDRLKADKKVYYEKVKACDSWQGRQAEMRRANVDRKRAYDVSYRARDPEKTRMRAESWRKRNPEKRSAIIKAYSARRRANCAGGDPTALIAAWESRAVKVCYWCDKACHDNYHIDHYQPLAKGGRHVISNLVISCPPCNYRKNAKDPYVFAASIGRLF